MKHACILLAEGFEEVEALTPADYLRRAGIEVTLIGVTSSAVKGSHGITVQTDAGTEALQREYDAIVLPGGMPGAANLAESAAVRARIQQQHR